MPLPTPAARQSEDEFVASCMKSEVMQEEFEDQKQRLAVCYEQYRKARSEHIADYTAERVDVFVPIVRAFESSDGRWIIYGYAAIFDSPDALKTVIDRNVVETSFERLRKYPAFRYMHRSPLGKIIFDERFQTPDGKLVSTSIDSHGFHIVAEVNKSCAQEWSFISDGGWGLSYGLLPHKIEQRRFNGQLYDVFVEGDLYEISAVDTPAHEEAMIHIVNRRRISDVHRDIDEEGVTFELTSEQRENLSDSDFAAVFEVDGKKVRKLPIHDKAHAVAAWQALNGARGGVDLPASVRASAMAKVKAALKKFGVETQEEKDLDKAEVEQMLKDSEKRILDAVIKTVQTKATDDNFKAELEAFEKRIMGDVETKLAKIPEKTDEVKKSIQTIEKKLEAYDSEIAKRKAIETQLEAVGADNSEVKHQIKTLEDAKTELMNVVTRSVGKLDERLKAIENAPAEHSPATGIMKKGVVRGAGFLGQFEAALRGGE